MMKKMLLLVLVMGIASLALATIQIAVDGDSSLADSAVWLDPSGSLVLGINGDVPAATGVYWLMVVDAALGTVSGGVSQQGDLSSIFPQYYADNYFLYYIGREGDSAVSGCIANFFSPLSGQLVDLIDYQHGGSGDVAINLYVSPDAVDWTPEDAVWIIEDTVTILQVPEPVTMVLLGIGGLLISRRRKGE